MRFSITDNGETVTDVEVCEGAYVASTSYDFFKDWSELSEDDKELFKGIRDSLSKTFFKHTKKLIGFDSPDEGIMPESIRVELDKAPGLLADDRPLRSKPYTQ